MRQPNQIVITEVSMVSIWDPPDEADVANTVCPKVPYNSNVSLFSAVCGWIPKPFDLPIATAGRFDLVYNKASIEGKYHCKICKDFWTSFVKNEISGKYKKI